MKKKKVVVLLPTFNEKNNVEKAVNAVLAQENNLSGWEVEVLIADSKSPDGTGEVARCLASKNAKVHYVSTGRGLGVGLIEGHQYSIKNLHPDVLAQMDADGQVGFDVLPRLVAAIEEGYDLALGSRLIKGGTNNLSPVRRLFTAGSSWVSRILIGPFDIKEVTNSARAFTPELFQKINLQRLPWREQTFIVQPAFLHEAVLAGAKYKEVPLVFGDRAEGYSKNKVFNYTYDVITYALDARLHQWGFNIPFFKLTRKAKTFIKFGLVGVVGTIVDFFFYKLFINQFLVAPATSKGFSAEIAILNNFMLNNFWTFRYRKTNTNFWQKLGIFNLVSLGGLAIGVLIVKLLHSIFGDGFLVFGNFKIAYNNFYFFATIPPVLIWNFVVNHLITWRKQNED